MVAGGTLPIHGKYRGLDDSRIRPSAVAGLRLAAHCGRVLEVGRGRQWLVQLPWLLRDVHRTCHAVFVLGAARNRTRACDHRHCQRYSGRSDKGGLAMATIWFVIVAAMISAYVLLDGFDLGAGAVHLFIAKTDEERRMILHAIGPVWDGNEVWLIASAGTLFFAFPVLYASSFSGFYLPLIIVLWLFIGRGIAIELRSLISHAVWSSFWDGIFSFSSALLAFFFGVALGNVIRGVPLNAQGYFFEALWTDFNPFSANPGILDWYTILTGLLAFTTLLTHGANYIAVKTEGVLNERARRISLVGWLTTILLA